MFIETLEFTIPIDLCDLFSTLKKGPRSNLEFPASVNSYGTTQDASIQVALRSNKLTFKVDGVSSDASMISKSECKTLKLSIFDVDRTLMPQESYYQEETSHSVSMSFPAKRSRDFSAPVKSPPSKSSRTTYSESPRGSTPVQYHNQNNFRTSEQSHSRPSSDSRVNVKQEPEDPDLIEIEPDPEPDDIVPKKETPYMQIDYSSDVPHTQTSQAALDRLSHPQSSHSQSPGSSSSSFHQNVPHVPDYAEPSTSQVHHGDQSADDFLVFQEQDDNDCDNDNDADFDNEGPLRIGTSGSEMFPRQLVTSIYQGDQAESVADSQIDCHICGIVLGRHDMNKHMVAHMDSENRCLFEDCGILFSSDTELQEHLMDIHRNQRPHFCPGCHKQFHFKNSLLEHAKRCNEFMNLKNPEKKKTAQCEECGNMFASRQKKEEHIRSQHRGLKFACVCGQTYSYISGLKRHMKNTGHTQQDDNFKMS